MQSPNPSSKTNHTHLRNLRATGQARHKTASQKHDFAAIKAHDIRYTHRLDSTVRIRANARMQQITATNPFANPAPTVRPHRRRQLAIRLAAIPVAAVGLLVAALLAPNGSGVVPAFATWTAVPSQVSDVVLSPADAACVAGLRGSTPIMPQDLRAHGWPDHQFGDLVLAEQRGEWVLLSYSADASNNGFAGCLVRFTDGQAWLASGWLSGVGENRAVLGVADLGASDAGSSGGSEHSGHGVTIVGSQRVSGGTSLTISAGGASGDLAEVLGGQSSLVRITDTPADDIGTFMLYQIIVPDEGALATFMAAVGPEVVGAEIQQVLGDPVTATVTNGQLVAWWPSGADDATGLVASSSLGANIAGITLTLTDGTVRHLNPIDLR